jgi:hemin uptake protein HemP
MNAIEHTAIELTRPRRSSASGTSAGTFSLQAASKPQPSYRSADLFGDGVEVLIEHDLQTYRLRRTSLGKLILTK